jgi:hypothetical protein
MTKERPWRYYCYDSPNKGMGNKKFFHTKADAQKWVKNNPLYPTVVLHIYKV